MVIRPKSRATVVFSLFSTPARSSTPTLALVSASSVVSGGISLTEPTMVVLPVPKPPAITILTDRRIFRPFALQLQQSIEDAVKRLALLDRSFRVGSDTEEPFFQQHVDQHLGARQRSPQMRADLGDGLPPVAQIE